MLSSLLLEAQLDVYSTVGVLRGELPGSTSSKSTGRWSFKDLMSLFCRARSCSARGRRRSWMCTACGACCAGSC